MIASGSAQPCHLFPSRRGTGREGGEGRKEEDIVLKGCRGQAGEKAKERSLPAPCCCCLWLQQDKEKGGGGGGGEDSRGGVV